MRAAIVGVGSLGTIIGALITQAGMQIDLVDTFQAHVDALNASGIRAVFHDQTRSFPSPKMSIFRRPDCPQSFSPSRRTAVWTLAYQCAQ
jgi:ketopantoate reductase